MKDNATSAIKIKYRSSCKNDNKITEKNKCDGLKVGDKVTFSAEITVVSCPKNPKDWHQTFQIYPVGINESLIIDLEMLCSCPCEYEDINPINNEKYCNNNGKYKCGLCECDTSYFGNSCECSA